MNDHQPDVRGLIAAQSAVGVQQEARIAQLEEEVLARDQQVLADGRTIVDQRIKLDSARQILERVLHYGVQHETSRRIEHWLASTTCSEQERLLNHLVTTLVMAAVGWSGNDGTTLEDLQQAAHQLRAAGEA